MKARNLLLTATLCGLSSGAWASGFALSVKSASNAGNAFSGTTTLAEDASVVFSNPAAMQDMEGSHFTALLNTVMPDLRYKDEGSNTGGTASTSVTDPHYIPNLYYVNALSSDVRFGFGIYAPFGLGLDYADNWSGRFITTGSNLQIINFSPALSFKAGAKTSLAVGADMQYLNATLKNAMDYNTICGGLALAGYPTGGCVGAAEGSQELTGTSWSLGYTLGLTHDIDEANRFGMTFHSATRHDVSGNANFNGTPPELLALNMFTDTDGNLTLILPESLSLGYRRTVSPSLQVMADATWTHWSRYDELVVEFGDNTFNSRTKQNWKDVWRFAVGANYRMSGDWLLRAGLAYDTTPIPDAKLRSPRVPGGDRTWVTLGTRTGLSSDMDLDLALAYAPDNKYKINNTDSLGHNIKGEYTSAILNVMAQLNWKF